MFLKGGMKNQAGYTKHSSRQKKIVAGQIKSAEKSMLIDAGC